MATEPISEEDWEKMDTNQRIQAIPQMLSWLEYMTQAESLTPEEKEQRAEVERRLGELRKLKEYNEAYERQREKEGDTPLNSSL
jgi:hypothetical protein